MIYQYIAPSAALGEFVRNYLLALAQFNQEYWFLDLEYRNIDGSSTLLELVEHRMPEVVTAEIYNPEF